jgi:hypothetical protein
MPILSFWGSDWFGEKPKNQKKNQKNQKNPKKTKKKPMPNLRFKGSVWFFGIATPLVF